MSIEIYEQLKKTEDFKLTNSAWNFSKISHHSVVGYLIENVSRLAPKDYYTWEEYFYCTVADDYRINEFAKRLKAFVLKDKDLEGKGFENKPFQFYVDCVICRLIYETWLGYEAERVVIDAIVNEFPDSKLIHLSSEEDVDFAVDCILQTKGRNICGIQIKPYSYKIGKFKALEDAKICNKQRNEKFTKKYKIPVIYCYYKQNGSKFELIEDESIVELKKIILKLIF